MYHLMKEFIISFYLVYKVQHTVKLRYLKLDRNVWKFRDIRAFEISSQGKILRKWEVGSHKSLRNIHCIWAIIEISKFNCISISQFYTVIDLFFSVWRRGSYIQVPGSEWGWEGWVDPGYPHSQLWMSENAAPESERADPGQDWEGPHHSTPTHRVWDGVWDPISRYVGMISSISLLKWNIKHFWFRAPLGRHHWNPLLLHQLFCKTAFICWKQCNG